MVYKLQRKIAGLHSEDPLRVMIHQTMNTWARCLGGLLLFCSESVKNNREKKWKSLKKYSIA